VRSFTGVKASLLAIVVIGQAGLALAQDGSGVARTITVTGSGEAAGPPDQSTINAGVQTLAPTVIGSSDENQAIIKRIMRSLREEGIEDKDIQTVDYSVWPQQQHDPRGTGETTITGYQVNNTVRITVRDIDRLGNVLAAVTNAGANAIHGISFSVEDKAALEARAREAAMADARTRAEALAGLAGVELGKVLTISMSSGGGYPVPMFGARMQMAQAIALPDISAGELSVAVQVQVTYEIQ